VAGSGLGRPVIKRTWPAARRPWPRPGGAPHTLPTSQTAR
jgi:hypothetical protein